MTFLREVALSNEDTARLWWLHCNLAGDDPATSWEVFRDVVRPHPHRGRERPGDQAGSGVAHDERLHPRGPRTTGDLANIVVFATAKVGRWQAAGERIEQRLRLRAEEPPAATTLVIRGARDTPDKLHRHVQRTARASSLDGQPLLGISVFAVLGESLEDLLRRRFATFPTIYLPTAGRLATSGFELLPTAQRPHFTVRLRRADDQEVRPTARGQWCSAAQSRVP
jgi:hypothetical protein